MKDPKPFPVDALPEVVGRYVTEASTVNGYDPSMVALPLLSCLARAIGNKAEIYLHDDWKQPAVVWSMIVMRSGTRKSPALNDATRFMRRLQKNPDESDRISVSNYTGIALWRRLNKNFDTSVLVCRDELVGLFHNYSGLSATKDAEKAELLSCFDAGPVTVERANEKHSFHVDRANVSITGTIQPQKFVDAIKKEHLTDGMCAGSC